MRGDRYIYMRGRRIVHVDRGYSLAENEVCEREVQLGSGEPEGGLDSSG